MGLYAIVELGGEAAITAIARLEAHAGLVVEASHFCGAEDLIAPDVHSLLLKVELLKVWVVKISQYESFSSQQFSSSFENDICLVSSLYKRTFFGV